MKSPVRALIGQWRGLGFAQRIYRTADYLEVEDVEGYDVRCRRVFYDEIMLVTLHRYFAWSWLILAGLSSIVFGLIALIVALSELFVGMVVFFVLTLPALVLFTLSLMYRIEAITVFGRRTRARMQFWMRPSRALEVFHEVCRLARERQTRIIRNAAVENAEASGRAAT